MTNDLSVELSHERYRCCALPVKRLDQLRLCRPAERGFIDIANRLLVAWFFKSDHSYRYRYNSRP